MQALKQAMAQLSNALGVSLIGQKLNSNSGFDFEVRLSGMPEPYGLRILIGEDYLGWWLELGLDQYSRPLLDMFSQKYQSSPREVDAFISVSESRQSQFSVTVNGVSIGDRVAEQQWNSFSISASNSYLSVNERSARLESLIFDILGTVLLLLDSGEIFNEDEALDGIGEYEGNRTQAVMSKYERSRINRKRCLDYFGFTCHGCGQNMAKVYGPIGNEVIHVHHIVPVSQMGGSYRLNPLTDLVPLCPNCHNVAHKTNPPKTIQELREATGFEPEGEKY